MRWWGLGQVGHVVAAVNPYEAEELDELRRARAGREQSLGDLPLIVLTRGKSDGSAEGEAGEQEHRKEHALIAARSRTIAERSGHHIQIEDPEIVVAAVRDVLRMRHRARSAFQRN